MLDEMAAHWAPPDHPVFQLVPEDVQVLLGAQYEEMGSPQVSHTSFWDIYRELLARVQQAQAMAPQDQVLNLTGILQSQSRILQVPEDQFNLLQAVDFREGDQLRNDAMHTGGPSSVEDGLEISDFTSSDEEDDE